MNVSQLIALLIPLPFLAFWAWMFMDMLRSHELPACFLSVTGGSNPRSDWTAMFLLLNLATALLYYTEVYRKRE